MTINIEEIENQARQLLNTRVASVRELVQARARVSTLRAELTEAEREGKKAYVRATKDGWSEEELKKLGLDDAAVSRRRSARKSTATSEAQVSPASEPA